MSWRMTHDSGSEGMRKPEGRHLQHFSTVGGDDGDLNPGLHAWLTCSAQYTTTWTLTMSYFLGA